MEYRISVLMGIYNCALTLQEALDSLYAQTYQGFKIILCDDGSKDDTLKIAEENARLHENVVVIKNEKNMGLNYTLNHCLEYADTEYCARMDGDDVCDPTRFEKQIKFLDEHLEYSIVSSGMKYFDENGVFGGCMPQASPTKKVFVTCAPHCHAPSMFRTDAYTAVGGYTVDRKLLRCEDYHLFMKMYAKGLKGYNLQEQLYSMRDDRNAVARRKWKGCFNEVWAHLLASYTLGLGVKGYAYSFIPIIKQSLPRFLYIYLHKKRLNNAI